MARIVSRVLLFAVLAVFATTATGCYSTPEGGQVIVVRNGGPFDDKQIRQVVPNGAGNTWVGWASDSHPYPASDQQRIYKFDDSKDADADPVTVPTKDGVQVRLTGTFYINTAFDNSPEGKELVKKFDTQFGTRGFGPDDDKPYENFGSFLNSVVQPVIDSNIREVLAEFECKQLVASCALVQRGGEQVSAEDVKGSNNGSNVQQIQNRINANLATELEAKLGEAYFSADKIKFSLGPVELPGVQNAIDTAQSAFAEVSKVQADVQKEKANVDKERQKRYANVQKQKGYNACPSCARQDEYRALPQGLQTYAPGGNFAVGAGGR